MAKTKLTTLLATDGRCKVQVDLLATRLNQVCKHIRFSAHPNAIDLEPGPISHPVSYERIASTTKPLLLKHSSVFVATVNPYDNNFFWESDSSVVITSFADWSILTNLSMNNGVVEFICSLLAFDLDPDATRHEESTGCINDFMWDKRDIDARMRSGTFCRECYRSTKDIVDRSPSRKLSLFDCTARQGFEDLEILFDELAQASKREVDVLARWESKAGIEQLFDVFLCHNSDDKPSVRLLYDELVNRGLRPWFDEEHLCPGTPWQRELERTIPEIKSVAVIVGPNGIGPWQDMELSAFIREFVQKGCRVIPVLLKDAGTTPELPIFIRSFTWVDFRKTVPDPWRNLLWGITGTKA